MRNRISGAYSGVGEGDKDEDEDKDKDEGCSLARRVERLGETGTGTTWHGGV
jgi:hypothetical protein